MTHEQESLEERAMDELERMLEEFGDLEMTPPRQGNSPDLLEQLGSTESHVEALRPDRLDLVAAHLEESHSQIPFFAQRAERWGGWEYWRRLATGCPNLLGKPNP